MANCGLSDLPRPKVAAHRTQDLVEIPYPPPPARIEVIPKAQPERTVWVDGEWTYNGRRWSWRRGRFVAKSDLAFAPWQVVRGPDARIYLASGAWFDSSGHPADEPKTLAEAEGSRVPIVNLDGEDEPVGADVRTDRPVRPEGTTPDGGL